MKDKFVKFLEDTDLYNERALNYIKPKTVCLDHSEEGFSFYGCFPILDDNNKVMDIRLCVPKMEDDITVAINIHEYIHLLKVYNNLNKEYVSDSYEELVPVMYELAYLNRVDSNEQVAEYIEFLEEKKESLREELGLVNSNKESDKKYTLKNK